MRYVLILLTVSGLVAASACAGTQTKETMSFTSSLEAAGFTAKTATTPEQLAQLEAMPQNKLVAQEHNGEPVYLFADAKGCKCLYAGSADDYAALQKANQAQKVADEHQASLDQAPPFSDPKYVDVEAYGGTDPLPWW